MDQYIRWGNKQYHDQFYTDAWVKAQFKDSINYLVNRVNSYTGICCVNMLKVVGVRYRDDPTIFSWQLANEMRCNGGLYGSSGSCNPGAMVAWASEMSTYIKSIDQNHMVSVGDEGSIIFKYILHYRVLQPWNW